MGKIEKIINELKINFKINKSKKNDILRNIYATVTYLENKINERKNQEDNAS